MNGMHTVWEDQDQGARIVRKVWQDGERSYAGQIFDGFWRWAEPAEEHRVLMAVARWLDGQGRDSEADAR